MKAEEVHAMQVCAAKPCTLHAQRFCTSSETLPVHALQPLHTQQAPVVMFQAGLVCSGAYDG